MAKLYNTNAHLVNFLTKTALRVQFDLLPSTFKALYHKMHPAVLKVVAENNDPVASKLADTVQNRIDNIIVDGRFKIVDFLYLYDIVNATERHLIDVYRYKSANVHYNRKQSLINALKAFHLKAHTLLEALKKDYDSKFYDAVDPILSQISIIKNCYYYNLRRSDKNKLFMDIRYYGVRSKSITKGDSIRTAYPVMQFFQHPPKHLIIEKDRMENAIPLPLYIQSHAVHRLANRIGPEFSKHLYESLVLSCRKQNIIKNTKYSYLMEFYVNSVKLGYFALTVEKNIALIRSFKFITMVGTPEYDMLKQFLPTGSEIWQYLHLDSYETIINSDIRSNQELFQIFQKCNLDYLFEYSKGSNISIADILLPYVVEDQVS